MEPERPTDNSLALLQWENLVSAFVSLGHEVDQIPPSAGLPDMVFAANGATVVDGKVLSAWFRYAERAADSALYAGWFRDRNHEVRDARHINEGQGDFLVAGDR